MPPKIDQEKRIAEIGDAVSEVSGVYDGVAYLVPSPDIVAKAMGISRGPFYQHGTSFEDRLERATGLTVVHNGIVLGQAEGFSPPSPDKATIARLKAEIDSMHPRDRERLMAYLAINSL